MKPTSAADQRTKNRLREHPQLALVRTETVQCFRTPTLAHLFICSCHTQPWTGWIPTTHIEESSS